MASISGFSPNATADLTNSSHFQKTVCLYDWWLTEASEDFQGKRLAVGGVTSSEYPNKSKWSCTRQVQRVFTSSPITKRHDAFNLETADGICVVIKGLINKDRTMGNGFSSEIFNHFMFGFPPHWKQCALKYTGQEPVGGFASPREAAADFEKAVPSSLNEEIPTDLSKVIREERHDTQISEECSQAVPEVTTGAEQEQSRGIINQGSRHRRKSSRLSRPTTEPKTSSKTKEDSSNSQSKMITESNHSKVISEENHRAQVLKTCSERLPKAATDGTFSGDECDVAPERNGGHERNSNTLLQSPVESTTENITPGLNQKRAQSSRSKANIPEKATSKGIGKESSRMACGIQRWKNSENVMNQDGGGERNSETLSQLPKDGHLPTSDVEWGQKCSDVNSTPGMKRKGDTKQVTSNGKIKRKINFDASGNSVAKEAKKSMPDASPEAQSFKRSRSGRLLIPHMEYWRNQVPVYDRDRNITGILEESTVTPLRGSKSEPPKKAKIVFMQIPSIL